MPLSCLCLSKPDVPVRKTTETRIKNRGSCQWVLSVRALYCIGIWMRGVHSCRVCGASPDDCGSSPPVLFLLVCRFCLFLVAGHAHSLHAHVAHFQIVRLFEFAEIVHHFSNFILIHERGRDTVNFADKIQPPFAARSQ